VISNEWGQMHDFLFHYGDLFSFHIISSLTARHRLSGRTMLYLSYTFDYAYHPSQETMPDFREE